MAKKRESAKKLFGTKQVAELLKIPDWRVKNFSEGGAYGLPPSQTVGTGRGSRRLYSVADVGRLAVANELVDCGFGPEDVGRAIREIPESALTNLVITSSEEEPNEPSESVPVLYCGGGKWRVRKAGDVEDLLEGAVQWADHGIFFLNLFNVLAGLREKMRSMED